MYRWIGERAGPGTGVVCLSRRYGLEVEYHGWVRTTPWPTPVDVYYMTGGKPEAFDPAGHLKNLREAGMTWFAFVDLEDFDWHPGLEKFLARHGFRRVAADDRFVLLAPAGG